MGILSPSYAMGFGLMGILLPAVVDAYSWRMGWFGFFYGAIWPMYAVCARNYFPKEVSGTIIGLFTLFYGVGAMAGPLLAGHLADVTGTFRWPFGVGAAASLAAASLIGFLKRAKKI